MTVLADDGVVPDLHKIGSIKGRTIIIDYEKVIDVRATCIQIFVRGVRRATNYFVGR